MTPKNDLKKLLIYSILQLVLLQDVDIFFQGEKEMMKKFKCLFCRLLFIFLLSVHIFLISFPVIAQNIDTDEDKNEMKANINLSISWEKYDEQKNSNLEETGSISASVSGKLVLLENRQGVTIFYPDESGLQAQASYQNITTDKKTGEVYYTAEGSGGISILSPQSITDAQKQGHLEWMCFSGPAGVAHAMQLSGQVDPMAIMEAMTGKQKMDHYTFYLTVPIHTVITDKDGKINEGSVAIHFGLNGDELKSGSNSGSVSWNSEELEYGFQYQNFMEIKYEPPKSGNVKYQASWDFGEPPPSMEIHREIDGKWVNITDKAVPVITGEKIKLRAVIIPEDKDTGSGRWSIPGQTIKEFIVKDDYGHAEWLDEEDLRTQEVDFHWWNVGGGLEVYYTTNTTDGKNLTAKATFDVKEPEIIFYSQIGEGIFGIAEVKYKDVDGLIHEGRELILDSTTGYTVCFEHDPLPGEFQPGSTQYVQYVYTEGRVTSHKDLLSGPCKQIKVEGLDGLYPYAPGPQTIDIPGIPVSLYDLTIDVENQFIMQLMYKPDAEGAIFVPISELSWTWTGKANREKISDDWQIGECKVIAEDSSKSAEAYLEWDHISTGQEIWDACE